MTKNDKKSFQQQVTEKEIENIEKRISAICREKRKDEQSYLERVKARNKRIDLLEKRKEKIISDTLLASLGLEKGMIIQRTDGLHEIYTDGTATVVSANETIPTHFNNGSNISIWIEVISKSKDGIYRFHRAVCSNDVKKCWKILRGAPKKKQR